jgi:hypothetical protein
MSFYYCLPAGSSTYIVGADSFDRCQTETSNDDHRRELADRHNDERWKFTLEKTNTRALAVAGMQIPQ